MKLQTFKSTGVMYNMNIICARYEKVKAGSFQAKSTNRWRSKISIFFKFWSLVKKSKKKILKFSDLSLQ